MDVENIHYHTSGFLKDASYTADLHGLLLKYKDSFGEAEKLTLNLKEILAEHSGKFKTKIIDISEDGASVTINEECFQYKDTKGKITGTPSPQEVFRTLRFILDNAVKEYAGKFPRPEPPINLDGNQTE